MSSLGIDLAEFLDRCSWSTYQKWLLGLAALAFAADGVANQLIGIAMPAIIGQWHVHREALAPVAAAGLVGVLIGSASGGVVGDRLGRRLGLIGSVALFAIMTAMTSLASNITLLELVRFGAGLGIGGAIPSGAALITEITPRRCRPIAIAIGMVFIPAGGLVSGLLGAAILPALGWKALFLLAGGAMGLVALLFALALPESPSLLVRRTDGHAELLKFLHRCKHPVEPGWHFTQAAAAQGHGGWRGLFGPDTVRQTAGIWIGFFCCLLASYTMFSWLPTMLSSHGFGVRQSSLMSSVFNGGATCGGLVAGLVMQRFGARGPSVALAAAAAVGTLSLMAMPISPNNPLPLALMLGAIGLLISGLHNGIYTLAALSYPPTMRATGVGAAAAFGRLGAVASSYTGVITIGTGGQGATFFLCVGLALIVSGLGVAAVGRTAGASFRQGLADPAAAE